MGTALCDRPRPRVRSARDVGSQNALREMPGLLELMVGMLQGGIESRSAVQAAAALSNLSIGNSPNKVRICEVGAIPVLVSLLVAGRNQVPT